MKTHNFQLFVCAAFITQSQGADPVLMIPNASLDTVALFDTFDGSLIDPNFIDADRLGLITSVFIEAQRVGDEIWVTDALEDVVFRFSLDGRASTGVIRDLLLNNPEGFEIVGDTMLVASRDGVISIDVPSKQYLGVLEYRGVDSSINDITLVGDQLLVSNSDLHDVDVISESGAYLSTFIDSDGVTAFNFPQQINVSADGLLEVSSFSSPTGIYTYNQDGTLNQTISTAGQQVRGSRELGNGNRIYTNNDGVFVLNTLTGISELVLEGRSSFITVLDSPPCQGDLNGDGQIDFFDISEFLTSFGVQDPETDLNFDNQFNFFDISIFVSQINEGC